MNTRCQIRDTKPVALRDVVSRRVVLRCQRYVNERLRTIKWKSECTSSSCCRSSCFIPSGEGSVSWWPRLRNRSVWQSPIHFRGPRANVSGSSGVGTRNKDVIAGSRRFGVGGAGCSRAASLQRRNGTREGRRGVGGRNARTISTVVRRRQGGRIGARKTRSFLPCESGGGPVNFRIRRVIDPPPQSPVAQLVEQVAVNHLVTGSSPVGGAYWLGHPKPMQDKPSYLRVFLSSAFFVSRNFHH